MSKKYLARAMYVAGEKPSDIAQKLGYQTTSISHWATIENWDVDRQKRAKELTKVYDEQIDSLTNLALVELQKLLSSPETKDSDKVAAIRSVIDISGLKRDKKDIDITSGGIEVVINQIAIKPN